jgi:hypothetical protein
MDNRNERRKQMSDILECDWCRKPIKKKGKRGRNPKYCDKHRLKQDRTFPKFGSEPNPVYASDCVMVALMEGSLIVSQWIFASRHRARDFSRELEKNVAHPAWKGAFDVKSKRLEEILIREVSDE